MRAMDEVTIDGEKWMVESTDPGRRRALLVRLDFSAGKTRLALLYATMKPEPGVVAPKPVFKDRAYYAPEDARPLFAGSAKRRAKSKTLAEHNEPYWAAVDRRDHLVRTGLAAICIGLLVAAALHLCLTLLVSR